MLLCLSIPSHSLIAMQGTCTEPTVCELFRFIFFFFLLCWPWHTLRHLRVNLFIAIGATKVKLTQGNFMCAPFEASGIVAVPNYMTNKRNKMILCNVSTDSKIRCRCRWVASKCAGCGLIQETYTHTYKHPTYVHGASANTGYIFDVIYTAHKPTSAHRRMPYVWPTASKWHIHVRSPREYGERVQ